MLMSCGISDLCLGYLPGVRNSHVTWEKTKEESNNTGFLGKQDNNGGGGDDWTTLRTTLLTYIFLNI